MLLIYFFERRRLSFERIKITKTQDCSKKVCFKLALLLRRRKFHNIFSLYRYHVFFLVGGGRGCKGMFSHIYEPECPLASIKKNQKQVY